MEKAIPASLRGAVRKMDRRRTKEVLAAPNALVEQKAARLANYEMAKADVGKWEGAVMRNRLADRLVFPMLPAQKLTMPESNEERRHRGNLLVKDALERAQKGSNDLDAKIFAKLLPGKEAERFLAKTKAVAAEDEGVEEVTEEQPLQERLAELRVLKVKQGQMAAKLRQRAKIRSKNFHRHLKRQKIAQEAGELQALSSADPEAFKERLEALQKRRIEERLTQRHRQGGRWARQVAALKKGGGREGLDAMQDLAQQFLKTAGGHVAEEMEQEEEEGEDGWITVKRSNASNSGVEAAWNAQRSAANLPAGITRAPAGRSVFSAPQDLQNAEMQELHSESEDTAEEDGMEVISAAVVRPRLEKPKKSLQKPTAASITLAAALPLPSGSTDPMALDPGAELELELEGSAGDQAELEADFAAEKAAQAAEEQPGDLDAFLPGWNSWTGPGTDKEREEKKRRRFQIKAPQIARRDESNRRVVISERRLGKAYRRHQVREVPFPFVDASSWEAVLDRPVGRLWSTEGSHRELVRPRVATKMGQIIAPLSQGHLVRRSKEGKAPKRLQGPKGATQPKGKEGGGQKGRAKKRSKR